MLYNLLSILTVFFGHQLRLNPSEFHLSLARVVVSVGPSFCPSQCRARIPLRGRDSKIWLEPSSGDECLTNWSQCYKTTFIVMANVSCLQLKLCPLRDHFSSSVVNVISYFKVIGQCLLHTVKKFTLIEIIFMNCGQCYKSKFTKFANMSCLQQKIVYLSKSFSGTVVNVYKLLLYDIGQRKPSTALEMTISR